MSSNMKQAFIKDFTVTVYIHVLFTILLILKTFILSNVRLTLTYFMARSNLVSCFYTRKQQVSIFRAHYDNMCNSYTVIFNGCKMVIFR